MIPNYEKAQLLSIGNIAAKFEEVTPCSYRDMLPTEFGKTHKNHLFFSKFLTHDLEVLSPNYEKAHLLSVGKIAGKFEEAPPCSYRHPPATRRREL